MSVTNLKSENVMKFEKILCLLCFSLFFAPLVPFLSLAAISIFIPMLQIKYFLQYGIWKSYSVIKLLNHLNILSDWASNPKGMYGVHKILSWFGTFPFLIIMSAFILIIGICIHEFFEKHSFNFFEDLPDLNPDKMFGKIYFSSFFICGFICLVDYINNLMFFFR